MYCPKCNAEITGTESACPVCGVPFIQPTSPPTTPNGAQVINPDSVAQAVQNVVMEKSAPLKQNAQPMPTTIKKERKKTSPIIIILLVLFIILGILYFLAFTDFKPTNSSNTTNNKSSNTNTQDDGRTSYGGYKFDIPEGYSVRKTKNGLEIKGTNVFYTIGIDYTNYYETYKQTLCAKYNISPEDASKTRKDRKYLIYNVEENRKGTLFVTDATYGLTVAGVIIRKDNQFATEEDINFALDLIDKATENMIEYTPATEDNIGENGVKIYNIYSVFSK